MLILICLQYRRSQKKIKRMLVQIVNIVNIDLHLKKELNGGARIISSSKGQKKNRLLKMRYIFMKKSFLGLCKKKIIVIFIK